MKPAKSARSAKPAKPSSPAQERARETTARLVAVKRIAAKHGFDLNQRTAVSGRLTKALLAAYAAGQARKRSPRYEVVDHEAWPGGLWSIHDMRTGDMIGAFGTRGRAQRSCNDLNAEWQQT